MLVSRHVSVIGLMLAHALVAIPSTADTLFVTPAAPPRAKAPSFEGTFKSTYGTIVFDVTAAHVVGNYTYGDKKLVHGHIDGALDGSRLTFAWSEVDGAGSGHGSFTLSDDGRRFTGTWGYADSDHDGGEWSGDRD